MEADDFFALAMLAMLVGGFALLLYLLRKVGTKTAYQVAQERGERAATARKPDPAPNSFLGKEREIRLRYANVFAMLTDERREGLITHYRETEGVTRIKAMERACEDWEKHNRLPN